ncbi:MAG: ABC transporter substrate-binding protein [Caulobacterales bacterium]|nr:ABC transporter substrate-binding protein [Caulobacterales bacterium]
MKVFGWAALFLVGLALPAHAGPRVVSLDQCADQYVLALADRSAIAGVSPRADDADSWLRSQGEAAPRLRPTLEAVTAASPDVVVRYWGGDARLMSALERHGITVIQIDDATDFEGVRRNIRRVSTALHQPGRGADLIAGMNRNLAQSRGSWNGEPALYLTAAGWTAGRGTLIDAMMRAAGLSNAWDGQSFASLSIEQLILRPPRQYVLGFFDAVRSDRRGAGRHPSVRRRTRYGTVVSWPGAMLGCPAWFAADGSRSLARAAPRR